MIYESDDDRKRENEVADVVAIAWHCRQVKREDLDCIDRELQREWKTVAYLEIKCRNNPSTKYAYYMIDAAKLRGGFRVAEKEGKPFFLAVKFTDGIFWTRVTEEKLSLEGTGGRTDRGDPNDIEKCCYIPMTLWRRI